MFITEKLIAILAPHVCSGCGEEGSVLCLECQEAAILPVPSRCYRCQVATPDSRTCTKCRRTSRLKHLWVCTTYELVAKQLVHDFKFARKQTAAEPISRLMDQTLPFLPANTIVVHVPTATTRVRARGYDHAMLVARALARQRGLLHVAALARHGQARQVGATREQRLSQLSDAFWVARPEVVRGASVLLVDDLVTTGGSLEAAARCLREAGAKTVSAVVFAQKT